MNNDELNKILMKADVDLDSLKDRCHDLYEENQKLKDLCNKYEEEHNITFKKWQKDIQANKKAIESLKLKQIRYVNENDYIIDDGDLQEEINILQGKDND